MSEKQLVDFAVNVLGGQTERDVHIETLEID